MSAARPALPPGAVEMLTRRNLAGPSSPMATGVNMLIPQAYEPAWTRLDDGNFNDYPPEAGGIGPAVPPSALGVAGGQYDTTYGQLVPVPGNVLTQTAVLGATSKRGWLLIQNNSTTAGGTAPNLYVAFDGPVSAATPGLFLTLAPGAGILLDRRVPNNAIYVLYAGGAGTFTAQGVIGQGLLP